MPIASKEWSFLDRDTDENQVYAYSTLFGITPLVARVMINRGINTADAAKRFLDKSTGDLHPPHLLQGVEKAVERIKRAISEGEHIVIYGDYDVDGITSTALMVRFLRSCGANTSAYIPDRQDEGYGLNKGAIDRIKSRGAKLIVTVDTGITASDEVSYAAQLGIDMIITDHHECKSEIPSAVAVLNPKLPDSTYPFKDLAGVGVAFKLICAISEESVNALLNRFSDLIALGTIADVVSLTDENRVIADVGLQKMAKNPNKGIAAVIKTIGSNPKWNSSAVISYSIAPRLNAAGRMSSAMTAVDLLLTEDEDEAMELALGLDEENKERQRAESIIFAEAVEMINSGDYCEKQVLVLAKRGWHHGIIGVVASRICDRYNKSCLLISIEDDWCKSSGRSIGEINLFDALSGCADILENFGGHAYAAGFSIKQEYISELDRRVNEYAKSVVTEPPVGMINIDSRLEMSDLTLLKVRSTEILGPYGAGNATPLFALMNAEITDIRTLSEGKHCRIMLEKDGESLEVIAFGRGYLTEDYQAGDIVDVAGELNINIYKGVCRVQLVLEDCRFSGDALPTREDFAGIYRFLKSKGGKTGGRITHLTREAAQACARTLTQRKFENAVIVFADLNILEYELNGEDISITLRKTTPGEKAKIDSSEAYKRIKAKERENLKM
ncbi:MAG: single-stranded-DNA-specific exonuclease RecJ [Clostridia bacterium]|nr:single-stranded-DNA-specific exonuclease RecJ [Clostridia bacterium]